MGNSHRFKYILQSIGTGQKLYPCEVCREDVWEMFFQIELLKQANGKWTSHDCQNLLGHKRCLEIMHKGDS